MDSDFETRPLLDDGEPDIDTESYVQSQQAQKRQYRRRRYLLGTAGVLLAMLVVLLIVFVTSSPRGRQESQLPPLDEELAHDSRLEKYQTPLDAESCLEWSQPQEHPSRDSSHALLSTTSFKLPASTNLTFFVTRGNPMHGNFILHQERNSENVITVDVVAEYDDSDAGRQALQASQACFAGNPAEQGILLWADSSTSLQHISFNISVHLPSIREFHDFSTDFTNSVFAHKIGSFFDMWSPTGFGAVHLNARNAPIVVGTMIAPSAFVSTINAPITADFWVTEALHIQSDNAPVYAVLFAIGGPTGAEVTASVRTSNANVTAALAMTSDFDNPKLNASVHTSNGELTVITPRYMPYPGVFALNATTSNARGTLWLHREFEGTFDLSTTGGLGGGKAVVEWGPDKTDPAGKGRSRVLNTDKVNEKAHKVGSIYWGERPPNDNMGDITFKTTLKDVVIKAKPST